MKNFVKKRRNSRSSFGPYLSEASRLLWWYLHDHHNGYQKNAALALDVAESTITFVLWGVTKRIGQGEFVRNRENLIRSKFEKIANIPPQFFLREPTIIGKWPSQELTDMYKRWLSMKNRSNT